MTTKQLTALSRLRRAAVAAGRVMPQGPEWSALWEAIGCCDGAFGTLGVESAADAVSNRVVDVYDDANPCFCRMHNPRNRTLDELAKRCLLASPCASAAKLRIETVEV